MLTVFWDFDWSMANENSDVYVIKILAPKLYDQIKEIRDDVSGRFKEWNPLMNELMRRLYADYSISKTKMIEAIQSLPMFDAIDNVIRQLHQDGVRQIIVSDANKVFIESVLVHRKLLQCIDQIWTNPAYFDSEERLHIGPCYSIKHGCDKCPPNLCKGSILAEEYILASPNHRFAYVGDGNNDFCPALQLRCFDVLLARQDYALHKKVSNSPNQIRASFKTWIDGNQLRELLLEFVSQNQHIEAAVQESSPYAFNE